MIQVYANTAHTQRKEYRVAHVKHGTTSTGGAYTSFTVCDGKKNPDGTWHNEYYDVVCYSFVPVKEKGKISFKEIFALEIAYTTYNGTERLQKRIFADCECKDDISDKMKTATETEDVFPF